ncbi:MAG TPA: DedA family protein [Opitutaceae bacterium]|nr:DedA family protein [Opitutaceae bacterium]
MHEMFRQLIDWYLHSLDKGGYWLVALLMAIESSVVPLPSEFVIPPAAHLAHTQGRMSVAGVVIAGALGSWIGATIMYWASRLAGRPLVMRWARTSDALLDRLVSRLARWPWLARWVKRAGHGVVISPEKVAAAERWSDRYGPFGIFFSRLLPVVRHLIGIPAGIVRLNYWRYALYTLAGSTLWCTVLAWIGITAGQDEALMRGELHRVTLWVVGAFLVLGTMYYLFVHRQMKARKD